MSLTMRVPRQCGCLVFGHRSHHVKETFARMFAAYGHQWWPLRACHASNSAPEHADAMQYGHLDDEGEQVVDDCVEELVGHLPPRQVSNTLKLVVQVQLQDITQAAAKLSVHRRRTALRSGLCLPHSAACDWITAAGHNTSTECALAGE